MKYEYKCVFISGFRGRRLKKINKYAYLGWELVCLDGCWHYFKKDSNNEANLNITDDLKERFLTNSSDNFFEVWSRKRIQNQPKRWQIDLKNTVFNELLKIKGTGFLHANYISIIRELSDLENILTNDIGYGAFKNMDLKGLCFERIFNNPPGSSIHPQYHHYLSYLLTKDFNNTKLYWVKSESLLKWDNLYINLSSSLCPDAVWLGMKKCKVDVFSKNKCRHIGIYIKIKGDLKKQTLFTFLKPLIDGLICSCHIYNGHDLEEISERISKKFDKNKKDIQKLLVDDKNAVLGEKNFIHLSRDYLQWSPADDKIVQIYLDYQEVENKIDYEIDGEIYKVERVK